MLQRFKKLLRNSLGVSLMEVMVTVGLLGTGSYVIMLGIGNINFFKEQTVEFNSMDTHIMTIFESIRANPQLYKIDYAANTWLNKNTREAVRASLPLAWNKQMMTTVEKCDNCVGRMGFVVEPFGSYRGMYKVTLRITNDEMKEPFQEFIFIVGEK